MEQIDYASGFLFREFDSWAEDHELTSRLLECIRLQKAAESDLLRTRFEPHEHSREEVSEEALEAILEREKDVASIGLKNRRIANCIVFGSRDVEGAVRHNRVRRLMRHVDAIVARKVKALFRTEESIWAERIGHFWYPPTSYMGWHTNSNAPGWRMYVTYCDEAGKSYFRYRDPRTHEIVTSYDRIWTVRLFKVSGEDLMWHSIYSDTNRYSFGYRIVDRPRLGPRVANKLGRVWRDVKAGRVPRLRDV